MVFIEITVAAAALNLQPKMGSTLYLFKAAGGARIVNNDLMVREKIRPWNLGSEFLRKVLLNQKLLLMK